MALPLKDFRPGLSEVTHKVMSRVAKRRGITMESLGREIMDHWCVDEVKYAKDILGIDTDAAQLDLIGNDTESTGTPRKGRK